MRDFATQSGGAAVVPLRPVVARPYVWRDPASIPTRPWIYGRQLLRGSVSVVIAPGATGKTALLIGTALALATGRPLLGKAVWERPQTVWLWNLEDSEEEIARLVQAAALHWSICADDLRGRLYLNNALEGSDLKTAVATRDGFEICEPIIEALVSELVARRVDVLVVDPFVSSHSVNENDNGAIDAVAKQWAMVAVRAACSIVLVHHSKKLGGAEVSAEASRGASALANAARSVLALNRMSDDEADKFGIEGEDRRRLFRAYDDKNNRAPPAESSDWFRLESVSLENGDGEQPADSMQVVVPWSPPDMFDGVTVDDLRAVQSAVAQHGQCRESKQAADWVGNLVADTLGLDLARSGDRAKVKGLLAQWVRNDALRVETRPDSKRTPRKFIVVGKPVEE